MIAKNNFNTLLKNRVLLVLLLVSALLCGFLFSYLYAGNIPLMDNYNREMESSNVEQFRILPELLPEEDEIKDLVQEYEISLEDLASKSFSSLCDIYHIDTVSLLTKRMEELEAEYHFTSELLQRKYYMTDHTVWYLFTEPEFINKITLAEGSRPSSAGEVLLSYQYAQHHSIAPGDDISVSGLTFRVTGLYTQAAESLIYNAKYASSMNSEFNAGVILTTEGYRSIENADEEMIFVAVFDGNFLQEAISEMLNDERVSSVVESKQLTNYNTLLSNFSTSLTIMVVGILIFLIVISIMMLIIISNWFQSNQKSFGIFLGMGYSRLSLSFSFLILLFPVVLGVGGGSAVGLLMAESFIKTYCDVFNVVPAAVSVSILVLVLMFDLAVIFLFSALIVLRALHLSGQSVISMITNRSSDRVNVLITKAKSLVRGASYATRIKSAYMLKHFSRFLTMIFVCMLAIILVSFSLSIYNLSHKNLDALSAQFRYTQIVNYSDTRTDLQYDNLKNTFYKGTLYFVDTQGKEINRYYTIYAINSDCYCLDLRNQNGDSLLAIPEKQIVISAKLADQYSLSIGNVVHIRSVDGNLVPYTVFDINTTQYDTNLYVGEAAKTELFDCDSKDAFNGEFTNIQTAESDDCKIITKDQQLRNIESLLSGSTSLIPVLFAITVIVIVSISCLIAYINIRENKKDIIILSLLGYRDGQIFRLIINLYSAAVIIGIVLGFFLVNPFLQAVQSSINTSTDIMISLFVDPLVSVLAGCAIFVFYNLVISAAMFSLKKINHNEILAE